jgi:hypothetical protein
MPSIQIEQVPMGSPRIRNFADFPWSLHKHHAQWTPPLCGDLLGNRLFGLTGLLTKEHPYHRYAEGHTLLLEDNHLILSPSEFMGARRYKTWRIYDLTI